MQRLLPGNYNNVQQIAIIASHTHTYLHIYSLILFCLYYGYMGAITSFVARNQCCCTQSECNDAHTHTCTFNGMLQHAISVALTLACLAPHPPAQNGDLIQSGRRFLVCVNYFLIDIEMTPLSNRLDNLQLYEVHTLNLQTKPFNLKSVFN